MAAGANPATTWDEQAFKNDVIRQGLVDTPLLFIAALLYFKGDWMEFCNTFAFSNWQTVASPCYGCWATKDVFLKDRNTVAGQTL